MRLPDPKHLFLTTLRDPRGAARQILDLRLETSILWTALGAIIALNGVVHGLTLQALSDPMTLPPLFRHPWLFALLMGGGVAISAFVLTWVGQIMGGQAQLPEILSLLTWLQAMRLLVQAAVFLLYFLSPGISDLLAFCAGLWGLWITVNFLEEAEGFGSLMKAVAVLILAFLGVAFGIAFFLLLVGVSTGGIE